MRPKTFVWWDKAKTFSGQIFVLPRSPISERCCFAVIKPVDSIGAGDVLISLGLINSPFLQLSSSLDARLHRYRNLSPIFHLIYGDTQKIYPLHKAVKYQSDALTRSCVTSSLIGSDYDEQTQKSRLNFAIISFSTSANMSSLTLEEGYKLVKEITAQHHMGKIQFTLPRSLRLLSDHLLDVLSSNPDHINPTTSPTMQ